MMKKKRFFLLLVVCLLVILSACQQVESTPIAVIEPTETATLEPTATEVLPTMTATPAPTPTLTKTPFGMKDLDKRTMYLFGDPATIAVEFLQNIQEYVKTDNINELAKMVAYPITIFMGEEENLDIQDQEEFIEEYDVFATEQWKAVVLAQEPMELFVNWKGIMIHRGQVWYGPICEDGSCEYFIYCINNGAPE
jgi:hypothetical protein